MKIVQEYIFKSIVLSDHAGRALFHDYDVAIISKKPLLRIFLFQLPFLLGQLHRFLFHQDLLDLQSLACFFLVLTTTLLRVLPVTFLLEV